MNFKPDAIKQLDELFERGMNEEALNNSDQLLRGDPDKILAREIRRFRSDVFSRIRMPNEALNERLTVLAENPEAEDFYFACLYSIRSMQHHNAIGIAERGLNSLVEGQPYEAELRFLLAFACVEAKDFERASQLVEALAEGIAVFVRVSGRPTTKADLRASITRAGSR